jgi:DNA-binding transcriptional regulator YdaS (Cro superfamily)
MLGAYLRTLHTMDIRTYTAALPRGGMAELAASLGISPIYLSQLAARQGGREPSPELAVNLEILTKGAVRRWDARPNDWWRIWPELVGAVGAPEPAGHVHLPALTGAYPGTLPPVTPAPAPIASPSAAVTRDCRAGEAAGHAQERQAVDKSQLKWPECGERREHPPEVPGSGAYTRRKNPDLRKQEPAL